MQGTFKKGFLYKSTFTITDNSISIKEKDESQQLLFSEIEGFTNDSDYTEFKPYDSNKNSIRVSKDYQNYDKIREWAKQKFKDLDAAEEEAEHEEILHNTDFGVTEEEREQRLREAKKIARYFNSSGYIILFWAIIYPQPYQLVCWLCFLFPFVAYIPYRYYHGLLKINPHKNSAYGNLTSLLVTPWGLVFRSLIDFNIFNLENIWIPSVIVAVILSIALIYKNTELDLTVRKSKFTLTYYLLLSFAFGFSICIFYNCQPDTVTAKTYSVAVIDKYYTKGSKGSIHYHVKLPPCGPMLNEQNITVNKGFYNNINVGSNVVVHFEKGRLNAPWFYVTD